MILQKEKLLSGQTSYPRECGGDPNQLKLEYYQMLVIPANAGVILHRAIKFNGNYSYPRECGGDPVVSFKYNQLNELSPRMRG